jgi:hypothetical protein
MIDYPSLANNAIDILRQHAPWLAGRAGAAVLTQAVKELWELVKSKLSSPGGEELIQKVESDPAKDRNWDTLKNHLLDAFEADPSFRQKVAGLVAQAPLQQIATGSGNKQANIVGSPGARIEIK